MNAYSIPSAPMQYRAVSPSPGTAGRRGWLGFAAASALLALLAALPATALTPDGKMPSHVPVWASQANLQGPMAAETQLHGMTLVLKRSEAQQAAFEQLLARQQDPTSADYHRWLSPAEIAAKFGPSDTEVEALRRWLSESGLTVDAVANSHGFIQFSGTAAAVNRAFQVQLNRYRVHGENRYAPAAEPVIPGEFATLVRSMRGLQTSLDRPLHHKVEQLGQGRVAAGQASPAINVSNSVHWITPADMAVIYDIPGTQTGAGYTIGVVGEARTYMDDYKYFRQMTGTTFANPTEIIPTAYGGVDPGVACPTTGCVTNDAQGEAELDVTRSGSIANSAKIKLVVATSNSGGIDAAMEYFVDATPLAAQSVDISWGYCESAAGQSGVAYWDSLFQQAAAEGISVFVASGDSGAAECDTYFSTPPTKPKPITPNYICSSSYATCVGGTLYNDTANPSLYWSSSNGSGFKSALSYIPEGAWNEPGTSSAPLAQATGGGVSAFIATPSWQTGTGVPAARAGRYTPDLAFSASCHNSYFSCMAMYGWGCVPDSNGSFYFGGFCGTSAAAPDMAGIAALLDQKMGSAQGNLNPALYRLAAASPAVYHDATVATSGVTGCTLTTASMCNNSIPSSTGGNAEAGYMLQTGYDEATGWGSLDVAKFLTTMISGTLATPVLSSPANGAKLASGTTSALLKWNAVSGATSYTVQAGASCGAGTTYNSTSTSLSYSPLTNGKTVYWRVIAKNATIGSVYSGCWSFSVAEPTAATPVFSPAGGVYTSLQTVTLTDATAGASIYYTVNGATPTTSSTKYTQPIQVLADVAFKAIAAGPNLTNSAVAASSYNVIGSPTVLAAPATLVTTTTATLNAIVNSNGIAASCYFQYWAGSGAKKVVACSTAHLTTTKPTVAVVNLTGLSSKTTYNFFVELVGGGGTALGKTLTFTTK